MPTRTTYLVGLALLLAGCCCPGGSEPYGPQPSGLAVLRVETVPPAEVWVDGTSVGMAPLETTVAAGTIVVDVRLGGFVEHRAEVTLGPGAEVSERYVLRAADVEDREVLQMLADAHELWVEPLPEPATDRGDAATSPAQLVYPRGELRASDLAEFRIDFGADAPPKGWVRFAKGGKPFYEKTFETPDTGVLIRSLPADVQTNLKAGDKVTWGYYPEEGEAVTGTFDVVDKDVSAVVAAMKKGLAGQPPAVVSQLVAQVYSDAGLHYAAHQLASRTIRGGHAALRPWAVVLNSLERMGAPKAARAFGEARKQVAAFSALQGREVYARPDYPVQRVLEHLDTGQAGRALLSLRKEGVATIAQSPQQVRMVAERAAAQSRFLAARSPAATAKVADAVVAMAKAAQEQA
ncbi:MAG: PEGA domain-containing protein, partial [Planctomycetota bacterium]|nr:PEGA domain-containing protein [Planctomycetota bacterium]